MTTPRAEVTFEDLPEASAIHANDRIMVRDATDGVEKQAEVSLLPNPPSPPSSGWYVGTRAPANPQVGQGWWRTTDSHLLVWDGSSWIDVGPVDLTAIHQAIAAESTARGRTDERLAAEITARRDGDESIPETIANASAFITFAASQELSDNVAFVLFNVRVQHQINSGTPQQRELVFEAGKLYRFAPRSVIGKEIPLPAVAPVSTTPALAGSIGLVPKNIKAFGDLDGDYTLAVFGLNVESLTRRNVDQWEVWMKNEGVHTSTGTWTPATDFFIDFNVSTSEETQVGLTAQDKIVPVRLVFRSGGQFVDWLTTYLTIGDDESGDAPTETRTPQQIADEIDWEISPGDVYRNGIAGKYTLRYGALSELGSAVFATVGAGLYSTARTQLTLAGGRFEYEIDATNGSAIADNTDVGASSFPTLINLYTAQTGGDAIATIRRGVGLIRGGVAGSGLNQDQVDARVEAGTLAQARAGNTSRWGKAKVPADTVYDADLTPLITGLSSLMMKDGEQDTAISDNAAKIKALEDAPPGTRVLYRAPGASLPAPTAGHVLIDGDDAQSLYKYRPKTLVPRTEPFGLSDFQRQDGTYQRWRGLTANYLTLAGAADGDVVWQTTAAGRTQGFYARAGGGWSPVANNNAPVQFTHYSDLAAATAAVNAPNGVVIIGTSEIFVVGQVLSEAWVPDLEADSLVGRVAYENLPENLANPGAMARPLTTLQTYRRVAYDSSKFTAYGVDAGEFMVGESGHANQVMFRLRDEDLAMHGYVEEGLGFGGRDATTVVENERIEKIDRAAGGRLRLTLAEGGFANFAADADAFLEAQSKIDQRLDAASVRVNPATRDLTGNITLDTVAYNIQPALLIANATINLSAAPDGSLYELRVTQDATGGRTLAFNNAIEGSAPTIPTDPNERAILYFERIGTAWRFMVSVDG